MYGLAELARLQKSFPYSDVGRHRMLIAVHASAASEKNEKGIVGFVDVDKRPSDPNIKDYAWCVNRLLALYMHAMSKIYQLYSRRPLSLLLSHVHCSNPRPILSDLLVSPDMRRKGIAQKLVSAVINEFLA